MMNALNLLGPALLLCALLLLGFAQFGQHLPAQQQVLLTGSALLVAASLIIRIAWGIGIRLIKRSVQAADHHEPHDQ